MAVLTTFDQLRDHAASVIRDTQIASLLGSFLNLTAQEIHAYCPWTWRRRKQTFATVADQETYALDAEVDEIAILRQISSPTRLIQMTDDEFYAKIPAPENNGSGVPKVYRMWEETGFSTNLAAADTIYVVSSSTSDGSSFNVIIEGRNSSGEIIRESITLNGTTNVTSSTTFAASGLLNASKSAATTGTISVYRTTGATLLAELEPAQLAPRYKTLSMYPVPSSVVTMYLEYYETFRPMVNDADVSQIPMKWNWVLLEGTLARAWEYKQSEQMALNHKALFQQALREMKAQDKRTMDYIPMLQPRQVVRSLVKQYSDSISNNFPIYGVGI